MMLYDRYDMIEKNAMKCGREEDFKMVHIRQEKKMVCTLFI